MGLNLSKAVTTRSVQTSTSKAITPTVVRFDLVPKTVTLYYSESDTPLVAPIDDADLPALRTYLKNVFDKANGG